MVINWGFRIIIICVLGLLMCSYKIFFDRVSGRFSLSNKNNLINIEILLKDK